MSHSLLFHNYLLAIDKTNILSIHYFLTIRIRNVAIKTPLLFQLIFVPRIRQYETPDDLEK